MKILLECFINTESGPVFTLGFARGLINNGQEVYAILNKECENILEWQKVLDCSHLYVLNNSLSLKKRPIFTIRELKRIKKFFSKTSFDYYIDTFPLAMPKSIKHAINYKYSVGIDHDAIPHSSSNTSGSIKVKDSISQLDYVLILSKIYVSLVAKKYKKPLANILYMRHGAMEYPVLSSQETYNDKFDINFLYFGRIDGYKGLHVLSKAYSNLAEKHENISLTVAGGGDFSEYKREYADLPNCEVINKYLTDDDIAYYFSKPNTVVVLPYLDATQSGVIGMAFNYRTPVIVSDTGGLKEQLFDGEMGLFVEPGNAQDLEDKMEGFILNKKLYEEQKEKMDSGYKRSTWDYVTKEFLAQLKGNK